MTDATLPESEPPADQTAATRTCPICKKVVPLAGGEWARHHAGCWPLSTSPRARPAAPSFDHDAVARRARPLLVAAAVCVGAAAGWLGGRARGDGAPAVAITPVAALPRPALAPIDSETRAVVDPLIAFLADPDPEVRMEAAQALGRVPSEGAHSAPQLVTCLRDEPRVRAAAIEALSAIGEASVAPLLAWLAEEQDERIARSGVDALGAIGAPAGPAVIAALTGLHRLRCRALRALGPIGRDWPAAVPVLTAAVDDPSPEVRAIAVDGLAQVGRNGVEAIPLLRRLVDGQDVGLRTTSAMALARIGAGGERAALPHLVRILLDRTLNGSPWQEARPAAEALIAADPKAALPCLLEALSSSDVAARTTAATLLGETGSGGGEAVPRLIDCLVGDVPDVRAEAARALGRIADGQATAPLARAVNEDTVAKVRAAAAEALGKLSLSDEATKALERARDDASIEVARVAHAALTRIRRGSRSPAPTAATPAGP